MRTGNTAVRDRYAGIFLRRKTAEKRRSGERETVKKLKKMCDSFDEDLPEDTTGNTTKQQQIHPSI